LAVNAASSLTDTLRELKLLELTSEFRLDWKADMPPISVAIAENCSVSLVFLVSMRVCPAERSAATSLDTSESMSSPEPMPVELIAMVQSISGSHVEKRARPLI
jgi:hypothetical protein